MQIPFVGGSYTERSPNLNAQRCVNLFPVIDNMEAKNVLALYGTPGLTLFSSLVSGTGQKVRGLHVMGDYLYAVVNSQVYKVTSGGTKTLLGTISTSDGYISMADNGTQLMIADGTADGHYISSETLNDISDADFPAATSVTFQDGYFIITEKDTGRMWISGLYDATAWDPLDFATAEGAPDDALRIISSMHDLWIFGDKTAEIYYNSGNADFPFERINGALLDIGIGAVGSAVKIDGMLFWLTEKGSIVKNEGYQWRRISTPHVDYHISTYDTISDAIGFSYTALGHIFYVLVFPTAMKTWVFDLTTQLWHEWESACTQIGFAPWSRHRANCCAMFGRKFIVGDYTNGSLYEIDIDVMTDNGDAIRRLRAGQTISKGRVNVVWHSLEIEFESGVGLSGGVQGEDPQAMLDWSDDGGHTWSNEHWTSIGKAGQYKTRAIWRRLGLSRNRIPRLTITDPVKVVIIGAYAELEACKS